MLHEADRLLDAAALAQITGDHARLRTPRVGERYVAGLDLAGAPQPGAHGERSAADRDWSVLTIARVTASGSTEVVEHQAWRGEATELLLAQLADRLRRVWRVRRVAVDATGLGGPLADLLGARLGRHVVEPVVFTTERKSRLGFQLLAAIHSGRLRIYGMDSSAEWAECRRQLEHARAVYRGDRTLQFHVDPADGHDDYLMSLALAVWAARTGEASRTARGYLTHPSVSPTVPAEGVPA